eukprot:gene5091-6335_t
MEAITPAERKNIDLTLNQKNEDENYIQKIDIKGKKARKLILVIGNNRIFLFKIGGKLEFDCHYLDILELRSENPKELSIKFKTDINGKEPLVFGLENPKEISEIILAVDYLFTLNFPGMKSRLKIVIQPESRIPEIYSSPNAITPEMGSCGGFTLTYFSICDYMGIQPINEVSWQIENILASKQVKEFDYSFFYKKDRLVTADARPIMKALEINPYFTSFSIRGVKLSNECILAIIGLVSQNTLFEKIVLNGIGLDKSHCEKLVDALISNKSLPLKELDLGNNNIEDKGMLAIAELLKTNNYQLCTLILNNCSTGRAAMSALGDALSGNDSIVGNLKYFDIGGNKLELEGSTSVSNLLVKSKQLQTFIISHSQPQFHQLKKCSTLTKFDNSGNKIIKKDSLHLDMVRFFNHSSMLVELNLSKCSLPTDVINEIFGEGNLQRMEILNLSENDLGDEGVTLICDTLSNHPTLTSLDLSLNFNRRSKTRPNAIESIINLIEKKSKLHFPIRSFILQGGPKSQLKGDLLPVICSLFYNSSLQELDIQGHAGGDVCAAAISKMLQSNSTLEKLHWDDNATTYRGLSLFKIGLSRNSTLLHTPLPMKDIASALKSDATPLYHQKLTELCTEIQQMILDNYCKSNGFSTSNNSTNASNTSNSNLVGVTKPRSSSSPFVFDVKSTINSCAGLKSFISLDIDIDAISDLTPLSFCYIINVLLGLDSLKQLNIPMYSALKRLVAVVILVLEYFILNKISPPKIVLSVFVMVFGAVIAGVTDLTFNSLGYSLVLTSCFFQASYLIFVKKTARDMPTYDMLYYNSVLSLPFITILMLVKKEIDYFVVYEHLNNIYFQSYFILSVILGFVLNFCIFFCTSVNSPLTTSVTGQVKNIASTVIGAMVFNDIIIHPINLLGLLVNIIGSIWYSFLKLTSGSGGGG